VDPAVDYSASFFGDEGRREGGKGGGPGAEIDEKVDRHSFQKRKSALNVYEKQSIVRSILLFYL